MEVVKGTDTRSIADKEARNDGIKMVFFQVSSKSSVPYLYLDVEYSIWCIVVLTSLIWKIRPVINESRPVSTEEYKSFVSKLKVVLIVIVMVAVVLEINHNNIYLNIMISGLLLTAITLIMGKVKYRQYKT